MSMAHAIRFYAAAERGTGQGSSKGSSSWGPELLHRRVKDDVFGNEFTRVLAGNASDKGQDDSDQEQSARLIQDEIGDRPDRIQGLYRTSDAEDLDRFIEAFEKDVLFDASWYVIEPHDCTHDRKKGGPCEVYDGEGLQNKMATRGNAPESFQS